jgi:hypothetical protein
MIFFVHERVCHRVMRSGRGIASFPGEKEMNAGLATRITVLWFMREEPRRRWNTLRDNGAEQAQPPETNHQSARRMDVGINRCRGPLQFGRMSWGDGTLCADYGSSAATGIGSRNSTALFEFWVLIHASLKHKRRGCSMPHSETWWD